MSLKLYYKIISNLHQFIEKNTQEGVLLIIESFTLPLIYQLGSNCQIAVKISIFSAASITFEHGII